jgi:two-component system response regulator AtoC
LYYRLNVLPIRLPALREHAEDVPALVKFFIDGFNSEFKKRVIGVSAAAATLLKGYGWPGNVRELRNVVERAMLLAEGTQLEAQDFGALKSGGASADPFHLPAAGVDLEELERSLVVQALRRAGGNQTRAAALLGLNRDQIRYRVEKFGLSVTP